MHFFESCRNRGVGTDVELQIGTKTIKVHSFILAAFSDVFHEHFFPKFYCKNTPKDEKDLLEYGTSEELNILQIIRWMYTGQLHLHHQTFYPIMKLAKKLQIQQIVRRCKKIEQDNIPLAKLPGTDRTYSNVEVQTTLPTCLAIQARDQNISLKLTYFQIFLTWSKKITYF